MAPVMAMLAQMQMYSFLKFTKSTLFAGIVMLLSFTSYGVEAAPANVSEELYNSGINKSDTLELPEAQTISPQKDTIPSRRGGARRSTQVDTTTVWLPDTLIMQTLITADSIRIEEPDESAREVKEHSPLKATMLSATLPGLGQAYNGKYWKIPILYAGIGGVVYAIDFNNRQYQYYRRNWLARVDGNPNTQDDFPESIPPERLQRAMNGWRRNVEISYIVGAALYILNILDATVDAHLLDFDVGEDLSLNVMPMVIPQSSTFGNKMNPVSPGIRLSFRF